MHVRMDGRWIFFDVLTHVETLYALCTILSFRVIKGLVNTIKCVMRTIVCLMSKVDVVKINVIKLDLVMNRFFEKRKKRNARYVVTHFRTSRLWESFAHFSSGDWNIWFNAVWFNGKLSNCNVVIMKRMTRNLILNIYVAISCTINQTTKSKSTRLSYR